MKAKDTVCLDTAEGAFVSVARCPCFPVPGRILWSALVTVMEEILWKEHIESLSSLQIPVLYRESHLVTPPLLSSDEELVDLPWGSGWRVASSWKGLYTG